MLKWITRVGALTALAAAVSTGAMAQSQKPTIVLLHGAFEDSSVWNQTEAFLHARGFKTVAVNLPGRPGASTEVAPSLEAYRDVVLEAIRGEVAPVVLVGHSFGGMTISNVAEAAPDRIQTLVYLAAYLPATGQALTDLSSHDADSQAGAAFRIDGEHGVASIAREARAGLFCNDCAPDVAAALPDQMVDEPLAPLATPVTLTAGRFGSVRKVYIHTARDQVVSPALQAEMVAATPVAEELTLDTGHAPFLSNPEALAEAIVAAVE